MLQLNTPYAALEYEIAQEMASTLGWLGRRLEAALAALRSFDRARDHVSVASPGNGERRDVLVSEAGEALWYLMIQRDACGLYDSAAIISDYRVPPEVANRVGPASSRVSKRAG
jgi:hypothetical protein